MFKWSYLNWLVAFFFLATACHEEKKPPFFVDERITVEDNADADAYADADAEKKGDTNGYIGKVCHSATSASDCGGGLFCVDGFCCESACSNGCSSCAVPGFEGQCTTVTAGTVCRAAVSACDEAEICDGSSNQCPLDRFKSPGDLCGDAVDNDCDNPDTCDINSICQPNYAAAGGACTDPGGFCKVNPTCDGYGICTSAVNKADGATCGDATINECDTPDSCLAGVCEPNYIPAGTPCGDVTTVNECNLADSCNGIGTCTANILAKGIRCGDASEDECNLADKCDGDGHCDPRLLPDETPCGDDAGSECDNPDSCLAGVCSPNLVSDGTLCNAGETSVVFRCNDTDCQATPQRQVAGWMCRTGSCMEALAPEWENVGIACTETQVCTTDGNTYAQCVDCDQPGLNECTGKVATGYSADGYCSTLSGMAKCMYDPVSENCAFRSDGAINCVDGACSAYTCAQGEHDATYSFDSGREGWSVGAGWELKNSYPWTASDYTNQYWQYVPSNGTDLEETYLLSPMYTLYACDTGTVSFYFTAAYQSQLCNGVGAKIVLECGCDTDWTVIWDISQQTVYQNPTETNQRNDLVEVDIADCLDRVDVQFRFSVVNACSGGVQNYWIDQFMLTAVQSQPVTNDTGSIASDTETETVTPVDTGTGIAVDTGTGIAVDTGTGTAVDTGMSTDASTILVNETDTPVDTLTATEPEDEPVADTASES